MGGKGTQLLLIELGTLLQNFDLLLPQFLPQGNATSFGEVLQRELKALEGEKPRDQQGTPKTPEFPERNLTSTPHIFAFLPQKTQSRQAPKSLIPPSESPRIAEFPEVEAPQVGSRSAPAELPQSKRAPEFPSLYGSGGKAPFFPRENHPRGFQPKEVRESPSFVPNPEKVEGKGADFPEGMTEGKEKTEFPPYLGDKKKDSVAAPLRSRGEGEALLNTYQRAENGTYQNRRAADHPPVGLREFGKSAETKPPRRERTESAEGETKGLLVELRSLTDGERVSWEELKAQAIKKVKDIKVAESGETKRIALKTEEVHIEAKLLKDSVSLKIFLQNQKEGFLSGIDFIKISQIFQSAGLRIESFSVNGSELLRERVRSKERGNISVDGFVSEDNPSPESGGSLSLLL